MSGSRTIKTLTALVITMTAGAFLMMLLKGEPFRPIADPLAVSPQALDEAAVGLIRATQAELRGWTSIIRHTAGHETPDSRIGCHFIIDRQGRTIPTERWLRQLPGDHVHLRGRNNFNDTGIGILIESGSRPTSEQRAACDKLERALRRELQIAPARIYAHGQLGAPGGDCGVFQD